MSRRFPTNPSRSFLNPSGFRPTPADANPATSLQPMSLRPRAAAGSVERVRFSLCEYWNIPIWMALVDGFVREIWWMAPYVRKIQWMALWMALVDGFAVWMALNILGFRLYTGVWFCCVNGFLIIHLMAALMEQHQVEQLFKIKTSWSVEQKPLRGFGCSSSRGRGLGLWRRRVAHSVGVNPLFRAYFVINPLFRGIAGRALTVHVPLAPAGTKTASFGSISNPNGNVLVQGCTNGAAPFSSFSANKYTGEANWERSLICLPEYQ